MVTGTLAVVRMELADLLQHFMLCRQLDNATLVSQAIDSLENVKVSR